MSINKVTVLKKMKKIIIILVLLICGNAVGQNASTYFPTNTGFKWFFKNTPLDSLNNPVMAGTTYEIDSFAANVTYKGLPAAQVRIKSGMTSINQNVPFTDTAHFNFQGTNGYSYLKLFNQLSGIPFLDSIGIVNFLRSFENWYNVYRFANTAGATYTIVTKDTTITFDTATIPLRITMTGQRLNDANLSTVNGTFLCKKFVFKYDLSYLLIINPLPPIPVSLFNIPETTYMAPDNWLVKNHRRSTNVDLNSLGFPIAFSIPGEVKELTFPPSSIESIGSTIPGSYELRQNYPNPFNPETTIEFSIPKSSFVRLRVFDINGREVTELYNNLTGAGVFRVKWNAERFAGGTYFVRMETGGQTFVRKMLLVK